MHATIPSPLRTQRLLLRPWAPDDAAALAPVLAANVAHLGDWIPRHVSTPLPPAELKLRLAGFAADFASEKAFRFAMLTPDGVRLLGEADLFPRDATRRVALAEADRVELGYWLDAAATGKGLATEATRALMEAAAAIPGMTQAEIRCDVANVASAAIPQRLGFHLAAVEGETQVWRKAMHHTPVVAAPGHAER